MKIMSYKIAGSKMRQIWIKKIILILSKVNIK